MNPVRICVISGTNRAGSLTRRVAARLARDYAALGEAPGAPMAVAVTLLDLAELPAELFSPTSYAVKPAGLAPFTEAILGAHGLVVVTPEYNGGYPGALKLFIDHLPFPVAFEDRPVAFVGLADGVFGGLRPVEQLAQVFAYRNGRLFNRRVLLPGVGARLRADDTFADALTEQLLAEQTAGFLWFAATFAGLVPAGPPAPPAGA